METDLQNQIQSYQREHTVLTWLLRLLYVLTLVPLISYVTEHEEKLPLYLIVLGCVLALTGVALFRLERQASVLNKQLRQHSVSGSLSTFALLSFVVVFLFRIAGDDIPIGAHWMLYLVFIVCVELMYFFQKKALQKLLSREKKESL